MIDIKTYFDIIIESERTSKLFTSLLRRYIRSCELDELCSPLQAVILYLVKEKGGVKVPQNDIQRELRYISLNGTYNFSALTNNGYLLSKGGRDKRCAFLTLTEKGETFYKDLIDYISKECKAMKDQVEWDKENAEGYLLGHNILQSFLEKAD